LQSRAFEWPGRLISKLLTDFFNEIGPLRHLPPDINTAMVDSLKVLDPERPIREADIASGN
jgi:hypothetical protein